MKTLLLTIAAMGAPDEAHEVTSALAQSPLIGEHAVEETYAISRWIMDLVRDVMGWLGLHHDHHLEMTIYATIIFLISIGVGMLVKWVVLRIVYAICKRHESDLLRTMRQLNFFSRTSRVIEPFLFLLLLELSYSLWPVMVTWLIRAGWIWVTLVLTVAMNTLINVIWIHVDEKKNKKHLPLNGLSQLLKGLLWILAVIVIFSILIHKSPGAVFAGLGAFAAVLMLIFKDSILGVVASVQLSENDSLHIGDWIVTDKGAVNGTVLDVSLTTVKVLNWDKTITNLPPYSLIQGAFTNYTNMQQSQTRRICRTFQIDGDSVALTDDALIAQLQDIPLMKEWIAKKQAQKAAGQVKDWGNPEGLADGSLETNLGMFRAYMKMWLDANPDIAHGANDTCFVCTLQQSATGIPFQIYCFTATSHWVQYEAIQSKVFEHLSVMLPKFNLYLFESNTGRDEIINGMLESNRHDVSNVFGIPSPIQKEIEDHPTIAPPQSNTPPQQ